MVILNEDFIFRLKSVCDITSIVSNYVELKFTGKNKKCCCPFHSEKTPSFVVFEGTGSFYCFGCGIGGDVITFIEKIENLDYIAAVKLLCKYAGIEFPEDTVDDRKYKLRRKILEINKEAARFFHKNLTKKEGREGLIYFNKKRRLKKETIVKFGLGFALNSWDSLKNHLKQKGFSYEEMVACDLVLKSKNGGFYDKFRNRVIFPIIDLKGDVVGFGGRVISDEDSPKYLNSSDTLVFKKSFLLFGLNFAKNSKFDSFLLCEGYLDVLTLHQNGIDGAIATLGTSLTKEQVRLLKRNFKDIVLAYDMDFAGRKAAKRAVEMFEEIGINVRVLNFKGCKDPDEFIKKNGVRNFILEIRKSTTMDKLEFSMLEKKYDLKDLEQRKNYIKECCNIIARQKDLLKRDIYIGEICQKMNLDRFVILNHVKFIINKNRKRFEKNFNISAKKKITKKEEEGNILPLKVTKAEEGVLRFIYYNPDKIDLIKNEIDEKYFNLSWHKSLYVFMLDAIEKKRSLDFSIFHEILKDWQIGEFSRIINFNDGGSYFSKKLKDYLDILKNYYEEKKQDVKNMTAEELEKIRQRKAELKR